MKSVLAAALAVAAVVPQGKTTKPHPRQIFVTVVNGAGLPVVDLAQSDFEVRENGVKRELVKADLATSPMRIALMLDTGDGMDKALNHLRLALAQFADAVPPPHEIMMVSTGRQVRVRVQPTADRKKIKDAAAGLFLDGGGTPLMDGLMEIDDRFMKKAEDRWPVFVIVTSDGSEASAGANEKKFNDWLKVLPSRGVSAHAVSIKYRGGGVPEIVAQHVALTVGGLYDYVNTSNSLPEKMTAIAQRLASDFDHARSRYQITYITDAADPQPVDVGVAREGVRLLMSAGRVR
jgi:hypothetical protein